MAMTLIEKILASHSKFLTVHPGQIVDIDIDVRVARDFGGANVVKNIRAAGLTIHDPGKTFFTFDCNPTGSDQKYTVNQHICRLFAREQRIKVFDINEGIGTHILIEKGLVYPGSTAVSTDSHANVLGAIGAFGQGMGDMDIAAAWHNGSVWFKVPGSVRIDLSGKIPLDVTSKDIILNLLSRFGANSLLGYSVEMYGEATETLGLDDRITISSMATEMGAIIILFPPSDEINGYCHERSSEKFAPVYADEEAFYEKRFSIDASEFNPMISRPGEPHDAVKIAEVAGIKIDSAFIGSCTNGRMNDMRAAAEILRDRKVAPGVVLKIVPATDQVWDKCLEDGLISIFKRAGAMVSNAGCAGCAAGQVGQNGQGEITVSTGNRNFPGKQGRGSVYLASPAVVAASAVAGFITVPAGIPDQPALFTRPQKPFAHQKDKTKKENMPPGKQFIEGRVRLVRKDNIDTDMIFHNRYLSITAKEEMGQYTFDNLAGFEDFSKNIKPGDILVTGRNFGCGSSRQQAVDCFISLGISAIIAVSFGAIYERNAINAALPVIKMDSADNDLNDNEIIKTNLLTGEIENLSTGKKFNAEPFSEVQYEIYKRGGLLA
jgi:homoaconitate hydratase family protein/3-isopropylmalate dehydratase small subunit